MTDTEGRRFFGERYDCWLKARSSDQLTQVDTSTLMGRTISAAVHLSEHMHELPALIFCCGKRDCPFKVAEKDRTGLAPPSFGSIYPAVQNLMLAYRGLGLGAILTTMQQMFEEEMHEFYGIRLDHGVVAVVPIGFRKGQFGSVTREPLEARTHFNRWGGVKRGLAEPEITS